MKEDIRGWALEVNVDTLPKKEEIVVSNTVMLSRTGKFEFLNVSGYKGFPLGEFP